MCAEENHAAVRRKHAQQRAKQQPSVHIETGKRLIQDDQIRIVQQRRRDEHALPHPLREGSHGAIAAVVQLKQSQQVWNLFLERDTRKPAKARDEREVLNRGEVCIKERLLGNVADLLVVSARIFRQGSPVERNGSGCGLEQSDDDVDGRALARAVWTQISNDLARVDLETHPVERQHTAVPLRESACFEHVCATFTIILVQ